MKNFQLVEPSEDGMRQAHLLNYNSKGKWHRACNRKHLCIVAIRSVPTDGLHLDCNKCNSIFYNWMECEAAGDRIKESDE